MLKESLCQILADLKELAVDQKQISQSLSRIEKGQGSKISALSEAIAFQMAFDNRTNNTLHQIEEKLATIAIKMIR